MRQIIKLFMKWLRSVGRKNSRSNNSHYGVTDKQTIARGVKRFFEQNYELRYNVLKQTEEFRPRKMQASHEKIQASHDDGLAPHEGWRQMTDRDLRRIAIEQMEQVGVAWSIDVELYVRSALVARYNPVLDYLSRCGPWDGTDHQDHGDRFLK